MTDDDSGGRGVKFLDDVICENVSNFDTTETVILLF